MKILHTWRNDDGSSRFRIAEDEGGLWKLQTAHITEPTNWKSGNTYTAVAEILRLHRLMRQFRALLAGMTAAACFALAAADAGPRLVLIGIAGLWLLGLVTVEWAERSLRHFAEASKKNEAHDA